MVLDMLDVEKVKSLLQDEIDKREKAKVKWLMYRTSYDNEYLEELYERRYHRYCSRFNGMCDLLFDLGILAWCNDDYKVCVEIRVD